MSLVRSMIQAPWRLHQRGATVPAGILDAAHRALQAIDNGDTPTEDDLATVLTSVEDYMKKRMVPGADNANISPADFKPCGQADGVIFIGGLRDPQEPGKWIVQSKQRQAFNYLKPASYLERVQHNARSGLSKPKWDTIKNNIPAVFAELPAILRATQPGGLEIHAFFTVSEFGINCVLKKHRDRWLMKQAEEKIWTLFYT